MWLPNDDPMYPEDSTKEQSNEKQKFRSRSPPFEGGESLCELYIERSEQNEKLHPLLISSTLSENISSKPQSDVFQNMGEEKLPSKKLLSLFNKQLLPVNTFTQTFLQSILSSVESTDPVVANAWMETLLDVIDLLPKEIIKGEILTLAVNKGQLSQPISSRLLCCKMLGKICTKFDPYIIKKEVLPVVLSLCQDVDFEVRGYMCRQLDTVAKGIGLEATKSAILPELVELANDEETFVRLTGIETVVQMLPMLDDGTCIQAIIPLVKKFCENSINSRDSTLPVVSKQLGRLCHGLAANFTLEQKYWFLKFFRDLAKLGLPHHIAETMSNFSPMPDLLPEVDHKYRYRDCRCACAYNFPAMVLFAGPENFENELYGTFRELCVDPFQGVRQTMASGFFEITNLLNGSSPFLLPDLVHLLQDESVEVLKGLVPYLPESLKAVCCASKSEIDNKKFHHEDELVKALISCEETTSVTSNWRLHADFLTRLSCLPGCISSETIFTTFVPLLFVKLHTSRPIPCRTASAYSLLVFLRNTPSLERRKGILNELIRELCYGRSCHKRMLFIKVCELVIELFSKAFFKLYFYKPLLGLSDDPVPNIRLRLCRTFPRLKSLLKLPKDSLLLQQLESCVRTLMTNERDRDVSSAVNKAIEELDKIEVTTEPSSRRSSCIVDIHDKEDEEKENEEKKLLELEFNSKFAKENYPLKSPGVTNIINRSGKIPVRKSGTLPKKSKSKDNNPHIVLMRTPPSSPSTSLRSIKQERRISSPGLNTELKKDLNTLLSSSKSISEFNDHVISNFSSSKISIPLSRSQSPLVRTWPRQKHVSGIPKQSIDVQRCPSPMPQPRRFSEPNTTDSLISKPTKNSQNKSLLSPAKSEKGKIGKSSVLTDSMMPFSNDASTEVKGKISTTHLPSPVLRRSAAGSSISNTESKIPTSNSCSKRRSTVDIA